jgi:hypothetical protein
MRSPARWLTPGPEPVLRFPNEGKTMPACLVSWIMKKTTSSSINTTDDEDRAEMSRLASRGLKKAADTRRCAKLSRSRAVIARRRAREVVDRTENLLARVKRETPIRMPELSGPK